MINMKNNFTVEGYSFIGYNDYASPLRTADSLHIILADDNPFCVQIEREGGERILQLAEGDVCIIYPKTQYHFYTLPGTETRIITLELGIPSSADGELERLIKYGREYLVYSGSRYLREMLLLFQRCHEEQYKSNTHKESVSHLLRSLVCRIAEEAFGRQGAPLLCQHTKNAIAYISKNYKEPISLGTLCEAVGIGERRMQKLFREELSTTFGDYLAGFRINKACDLLRAGSAPVEEIAGLVGYNSRQHFTRTFKQKLGQSPQQFRTAIKQRNYRFSHGDLSSMQDIFISFEGAIVE